ncbi:phosphoribosylamine--glycine ligase [Clostridium tarantellae]|uniref:Phosphoribosylamine--glycine ligase n=1 Tax=Clostridium tarantellae TaxID=39493 RepID=A0A6I1MIN5_9CLOT|nr:phosphoribosylamine--glycine ligase [Clostridium tarantellae]MPQ42990.1 phosphoribosylamine--glycine ligase [Clostridium tarantellae]
MNILLIGSGGREHAIARKLSMSKKVSKIFCAPGNGGTALENKCENINLISIKELINFAKNNSIDLTIVGPEQLLIEGIVDAFNEEELKIFGPHKEAAKLEGSKSFSKDFMKKYGVKTAKYQVFENAEKALNYVRTEEFPLVIKADGLAAGKGVYICETLEEANNAIKDIMVEDIFNGAGSRIVIEEFLTGFEASILSITDGNVIKSFISAKDHKQILDGDKGPNTGGMGVIAPNPYVTDLHLKDFEENIMNRTLIGIKEENLNFKGIIFFGLMITNKGTYLLEYNVRMGDPETQSVLALMDSDLLELIESSFDNTLNNFKIKWKEGYCCNVVLASSGYPGVFEKGFNINIDDSVKDSIYIAGGILDSNKKLITSGGRVLSVIGTGKYLEDSVKEAYSKIKFINFTKKYFRTDIGKIENNNI